MPAPPGNRYKKNTIAMQLLKIGIFAAAITMIGACSSRTETVAQFDVTEALGYCDGKVKKDSY